MITRLFKLPLLLSVCLLQGCILAPIIGSVSDLGVRRSDRERLLAQDVRRFNDALFRGNSVDAVKFASVDVRSKLLESLSARKKDERIVENQIAGINFTDDDGYQADVQVTVKYYRVPFYTVQERSEKQSWKFSLGGGWELIGREENSDLSKATAHS